MGVLTTFTIYNDGLHLLDDKKNSLEFVEKLKDFAKSYSDSQEISLGNFGNFCKAQKPRHADDATVYVHIGNTVVDIDPNAYPYLPKLATDGSTTGLKETKMQSLYKRHKRFFQKILELVTEYQKKLTFIVEPNDMKEFILADSGVLPIKKLEDKIHQELLLEGFKNKDNETLNEYIRRFS